MAQREKVNPAKGADPQRGFCDSVFSHWKLWYSTVKKDLSTKALIFMGWFKPRRRAVPRATRRSKEGFVPENERQKRH